jgi:hypothetical protein
MSYGSAYKGTGSNDEINRLTAQIGWVKSMVDEAYTDFNEAAAVKQEIAQVS